MRRTGICGLAGLILVLCLGTSAWAYNLQLTYDANANVADAYATDWSNYDIPGQVSGSGTVSQSATIVGPGESGSGAGTTRQVAVLTDHVDNTQSIINTQAAAYWYGYGQGFGSSNFGFTIVPGLGEPSQVMVTLGFGVSGTVNLQSIKDNNYLILAYASSLLKPDLTELPLASDNQTWAGAIYTSFLYSSGQEVTVPLNANELYVLKGRMQVDAAGYMNDPANSIAFDALVTIKDIQAVPLPPGIMLLGGGLASLALYSLRRRGQKG